MIRGWIGFCMQLRLMQMCFRDSVTVGCPYVVAVLFGIGV